MTRLVRNFALAVTAVWPAIALTTSASCGQEKDAFTDLEYVRRALAKAGFVDVDVTTVDSMEWHVDSADELYEIFLKGTARTRELLRGQTETEAEAVREELRRRFRERRGALRMPAVVSSGQKPL